MSATTTEFSFRAFALERYTGVADWRQCADRIADECPEEHLRDALRVTTPGYLLSLNTDERRAAINAASRPTSSRWDNAAKVYDQLMNLRERVDPKTNEWKLLRDCTRLDLRNAVANRLQQARANQVAADRLTLLERALAKHKAALVSDLPQEVVLRIMQEGVE